LNAVRLRVQANPTKSKSEPSHNNRRLRLEDIPPSNLSRMAKAYDLDEKPQLAIDKRENVTKS
jgi:hypothetical protein